VSYTVQEDESCAVYHALLSACQDLSISESSAACFQVLDHVLLLRNYMRSVGLVLNIYTEVI